MGINDLPKIRVKKVQTILSKDKVEAHNSQSGLWPKVVLELNGKEKKVSMPNFYDLVQSSEKDDNRLKSGLGVACMRLTGIKLFKEKKLSNSVRTALLTTLTRLRSIIATYMHREASKEPLKTRFAKVKKAVRNAYVKQRVREYLQSSLHRDEIQPEELTSNQVKEIWESLRNKEIVRQVMET